MGDDTGWLNRARREAYETARLAFELGRRVRELREQRGWSQIQLAGVWSARRGTYQVLYLINETTREVIVLRVEHRRTPTAL